MGTGKNQCPCPRAGMRRWDYGERLWQGRGRANIESHGRGNMQGSRMASAAGNATAGRELSGLSPPRSSLFSEQTAFTDISSHAGRPSGRPCRASRLPLTIAPSVFPTGDLPDGGRTRGRGLLSCPTWPATARTADPVLPGTGFRNGFRGPHRHPGLGERPRLRRITTSAARHRSQKCR